MDYIALGTQSGDITIWSYNGLLVKSVDNALSSKITQICFTKKGVVIGGVDHRIKYYKLPSLELKWESNLHIAAISYLQVSNNILTSIDSLGMMMQVEYKKFKPKG